MNHAIEVVVDQCRGRAEGTQFLVGHLKRAVGVGLVEDHLHEGCDLRHPHLDLVALVQLGVERRQTKPRAGGACHARHHAARQGAQCAGAGAVENLTKCGLASAVILGRQEAPRSRQKHLADVLPMRHPRGAFLFQSVPAALDFFSKFHD